MNPWRNSTDEEYELIISKRWNSDLLCWLLFVLALISFVIFSFMTIGVVIDALFELDMMRLMAAPIVLLFPLLGVAFSIVFIVKNGRTNRRYKNRQISVANGTVVDKKIVYLPPYFLKLHYLQIEFDNATTFNEAVARRPYYEVGIGSRILIVRERPHTRTRLPDYLLVPLPETAEEIEHRRQETDRNGSV